MAFRRLRHQQCAVSILAFFVHPKSYDSPALLVIIFAEISGWFAFSLRGLLLASRSLSEGIEEQRTFAYIMRAINALLLFGPIAAVIALAMFEKIPSR